MKNQRIFILSGLLPALCLVLVFTYYPFLKGILMAFQDYKLFDLRNVHFVGLSNFKAAFKDPKFLMAMKNSAYWVFCSLILQFILGLLLALAMKKQFRGRGIYQGFAFYSWALSGFLIGLIWKWMFNSQIGVVNDLLLKFGIIHERIGFLSDPKWAMVSVIVANVWYGVAFFAIMLLAALQSVPGELYEAADMDGATGMRKLLNVTLPYIMPTIIATTLLRAIWIFNDPTIIYGLTNGGPAGTTHILSSLMLDKILYGGDYGAASAIGIIMIIILLLYTIFFLTVTKAEKVGDF
ncbi:MULTISPECIES: carbohydrate ABC transporter permease [Paenibacillus]|uniref:Sugar ABC transporter permease n=1 Tax=Paenibacillus lignilyticus TaxID=1172615 RepID=A0ABS5CAB7_9BACL|nr:MULTISPECIES: sugar ABC transporter permease [Paenibacillus]MBP3962023.1 sugar ABC transporter permease [Paenibacillus lignilyticus]SFS50581.1 carbohydrate ABC transporter membrane protein 1, CUT1 family [Paenibacillus sp. BC26]